MGAVVLSCPSLSFCTLYLFADCWVGHTVRAGRCFVSFFCVFVRFRFFLGGSPFRVLYGYGKELSYAAFDFCSLVRVVLRLALVELSHVCVCKVFLMGNNFCASRYMTLEKVQQPGWKNVAVSSTTMERPVCLLAAALFSSPLCRSVTILIIQYDFYGSLVFLVFPPLVSCRDIRAVRYDGSFLVCSSLRGECCFCAIDALWRVLQDFEAEISSMPGCLRHSLPHMLKEVEEAWKFGVRTFVVFPKVSPVDPVVPFFLVSAASARSCSPQWCSTVSRVLLGPCVVALGGSSKECTGRAYSCN